MRGQYFNTFPSASSLPDMSKWVNYTPIFTGFGTVSGVSVRSRRLMDSLSIMGRFTAGTTTGTEARMTLGFDGVSGAVTALATLPALSYGGDASMDAVGLSKPIILLEPSVAYVTFGTNGTLVAGLVKVVANLLVTGGTTISFVASIPIEEWK